MKILKKKCPYCKKEITSMYVKQLEYNYQAHLISCKKKMIECRFKKTCEKKKCGYIINFSSCNLYKKYVSEINKKRIPYLGLEK